MDQQVIVQSKQKLQKVLEVIKQDIATIRTGKASPAVVENISVVVYGGTTRMRVMELATIAATDPQTLVITPFDHTIIHELEKGIQEANVGLNPIVDGQVLRISIPPLSQERREELIRAMKHKLENGKVMVRQVRHESMDGIKKQELSEDETRRLEKDVQKIIDETTDTIEGLGKQKEAELLAL